MGDKEYQKHLQRLQEEQRKALQETDDQINQWQKFKSDYESLQKRLITLPENITHDVMVPFGKMAFMPGQLVHTNDILVLLGDNWFAERSAKQAADIVDRRIATVNKHIEELKKQRELLEPRQQFTDELQQMTKEGGEMFEIREEYDEEKEKLWKEAHKMHVKNYRTRLKQEVGENTANQPPPQEEQTGLTNEELWARLDQLEKIEDERREMHKIGTKAEAKLEGYQYPSFPHVVRNPTGVQKVTDSHDRGKPDVTEHYSDADEDESSYTASDELDSDDDDEEDEDVEEEYSREITSKGTLIHFSHNKETCLSEPVASNTDIVSPGDIYQRYLRTTQPKSILKKSPAEQKKKVKHKTKKTTVAFDTGSEDDNCVIQEKPPPMPVEKAFSSTVVEKKPAEMISVTSHQQTTSQRPVSKFKSRSTNQNRELQTSVIGTNSTAVETVNDKPVSKFKAQRQKNER